MSLTSDEEDENYSTEKWTRRLIHSHSDVAEVARLNKSLRILHFNDVYNIESSEAEPKAGAARFQTAVENLRVESGDTPLILLFSGDVFSPSTRNRNF